MVTKERASMYEEMDTTYSPIEEKVDSWVEVIIIVAIALAFIASVVHHLNIL